MSELIKSIHDYYQNSGYITAQVIVPKQNLQNGILELQIIEGKIEKISLGKNGWRDKMQEFTAFENAEEKVLNIHEINRLQSNAAVMKIESGSAALTYSSAVNKSRLITSTEKENKLVYFEISASRYLEMF